MTPLDRAGGLPLHPAALDNDLELDLDLPVEPAYGAR
jgi:hypothetical protein